MFTQVVPQPRIAFTLTLSTGFPVFVSSKLLPWLQSDVLQFAGQVRHSATSSTMGPTTQKPIRTQVVFSCA
ncbi:hypothetical protein EDD22DRAFT_108770 [Suillus occidentalis]|nr:hypothetical protein EDD22DRAFT_108770 [Suillus occidentalis]